MLPNVDVTTIIWADDEVCKSCEWDVAQGDNLKKQCATIELNFLRIYNKYDTAEKVAKALIECWLCIYLTISIREDLIKNRIRDLLTVEEEQELSKAIISHILSNRDKNADLTQKAKQALIKSTKVSSPESQEILENVIRVLKS